MLLSHTMRWSIVDAPPALAPSTVQVWRIDTPAFDANDCLALLTDEERTRADRFRHEESKAEYITGHACLRYLLKHQLQQPVAIQKSKHGKPFLAGSELAFNITHSAGTVLIAFAHCQTIGVDLEKHKPRFSDTSLHREVFAPSECEALQNASSPQQAEAMFFHLWTSKEALLKADGRGLMLPSSSFAITFDQQQQVQLPDNTTPLHVLQLPIDKGYSAALALDILPTDVNLFRFQPVWLKREYNGASDNPASLQDGYHAG